MPTLTALCDLVLSHGSTPLTCVPLAAVEHIPSAAHLLPFCFVLRLHLLTGHVATEASLDLGSSPVGLRVIQWDVHDVLLLLGPAAVLLLRASKSRSLSQTGNILHDHTRMFFFVVVVFCLQQHILLSFRQWRMCAHCRRAHPYYMISRGLLGGQ